MWEIASPVADLLGDIEFIAILEIFAFIMLEKKNVNNSGKVMNWQKSSQIDLRDTNDHSNQLLHNHIHTLMYCFKAICMC